MKNVRCGLVAAAHVSVGLLGACSRGGDPVASSAPPTVPATSPAATTRVPDPGPTGSTASTGRPNDLPNGRASRTVKVNNLVVSAEYSTPLPLSRWTAAVTKPLTISTTAYVSGRRDQKIYLSRITIYPSSADEQGDLGSIDPIIDTAAISPGYLLTFPNSYGWRIVVPGVNAASRTVSLDIRYELLLFQGGNNPRDYSKQTVTDTLTIPLR